MQQTKFFFPLIFLFGEEAIPKRAGYTGSWPKTGAIHANTTITAVYTKDSGIVIPTQPTSPGEIMSGGEGEPVEADVPAEDETVAPQGMHVTGTQTVTHEYLTLNGKVARETIKTNNSLTAVLDFVYDESGKPFALKYSTNGTSFQTYYYVLNLQGDVVKLIHYIPGFEYESVATYEYDAWGNIVSSSGRLAEINPLRYRGYYYDSETGFYYLQSRYYDPVNRRFINADRYTTAGSEFTGTNLFAYCNNEPISSIDSTGHMAGKSCLTVMEDGAGGRPKGLSCDSNYQYAPNGTRTTLQYESPYDSRANLTRNVTYLSPKQTREYVEGLQRQAFVNDSAIDDYLRDETMSMIKDMIKDGIKGSGGRLFEATIDLAKLQGLVIQHMHAQQMLDIMDAGTGMVIVDYSINGTQGTWYFPWNEDAVGDYGIYPYARVG